ncbi:hypothetical protein ACJW30_06G071600 [Castanea mollissima]
MESERPYRTTSTNSSSTSELFICFTSRLSSSSSMKLSSKSILSPGRTREPSQISLSSSLSRRLRSNGSMKGGQASPMFPTGAKKRGCAFENPEPSSPKVTCIGQVRVKTKKQGKKLRTRSKRRGEASFRRVEQQNTSLNVPQQEVNVQNNSQFQSQQLLQQQQQQQHECSPHRNQRWVHLPVTICEGLRAFGAELNCFLPCRSSCMREKEEKAERSEGGGNESSCGAVFARWLVAMQESEGKGEREIELVVGEEESEIESVRRKSRREIFEGIEIKEERIEEEQEEGSVSICIPPKNALLLMRCRSDPVKMAALANRFWESPVHDKDEDKDEDNENVEHEEEEQQRDLEERQSKVEVDEICDRQEHGYPEEKANLDLLEEEEEEEEIVVDENPELQQHPEEQENHEEEKVQVKEELFEEVNQPVPEPELKQEPEALVDPEVFEHNVVLQEIEDVQENEAEAEHEAEDEEEASFSSPTLVSIHSEQESEAQALEEEEEEEEEQEAKVEALAEDEDEEESLSGTPCEDEETVTHERFEPEEEEEEEDDPNTHEKEPVMEESKFGESQQRKPERDRESSVLPDCLLLMMCEPKLSMEVSKETWVCSTDFIRWLPERPIKKTNGGGGKDPKKRVISTATEDNSKNPAPPTHTAAAHHLLLQPPRSSCSFPAAVAAAAAPGAGVSMATMIEQKLVGAKGYEPFVLTRCKSEPMRSSAKLMPEPCFWKNRNLEPHRPATLGVGAAGVGF